MMPPPPSPPVFDAPLRRGSQPGRNDPCSCGSGKKYKRCCLLTESIPAPPPEPAQAELRKRLAATLNEIAGRRGTPIEFTDACYAAVPAVWSRPEAKDAVRQYITKWGERAREVMAGA